MLLFWKVLLLFPVPKLLMAMAVPPEPIPASVPNVAVTVLPTTFTIKNVNVVGSTVTATLGTLAGIGSGGTAIAINSLGTGNNNNTFQNNNITKCQYGIYSSGASAANKNTGTVITGNVMNATPPNNLVTGGILVNFDNAPQIRGNDISVLRHDGTTGQAQTAFGIALGLVPNNTVTTF